MREKKTSRKQEIRVDVRREDVAVWESRGQQLASRPLPSSWSLCAWQHVGNKHSLFSCILLQAVCDPVNADRCIPPIHDSMCLCLEEVKLSYWVHLVQLCSLQLHTHSWKLQLNHCLEMALDSLLNIRQKKKTSRRNKHQAWGIFSYILRGLH